MEAAMRGIEAQLIEIRNHIQKQDEAMYNLNSKVDSVLRFFATKMESIVRRLPDGIRSEEVVVDDGEVAIEVRDRQQRRRRTLMELPTEIQLEIFMKMPVKSLLSCKCVCKTFRTLIQNPSFVQAHISHITSITDESKALILQFNGIHTNQYDHLILSRYDTTENEFSYLPLAPPLPPKPDDNYHLMDIIGSCNGLILIDVRFGKLYDRHVEHLLLLWNPVIEQSRCLPKPHYEYNGTLEFGFIPETNDYVVVKVTCTQKVIEVYKMSIDSWIIVDCKLFADSLPQRRDQNPVFTNGSFHWDGFDTQDILYYNLKNEELGMIKAIDENRALNIPNLTNHGVPIYIHKKLAVVEQSLAMIYWNMGNFEIWVMNDYGVEDSWALRFQIVENFSPYQLNDLLGYWANGLMVIEGSVEGERVEGDYWENNSYILYDVNTRSRIKIPRTEMPCEIVWFCSFMETLVPVR